MYCKRNFPIHQNLYLRNNLITWCCIKSAFFFQYSTNRSRINSFTLCWSKRIDEEYAVFVGNFYTQAKCVTLWWLQMSFFKVTKNCGKTRHGFIRIVNHSPCPKSNCFQAWKEASCKVPWANWIDNSSVFHIIFIFRTATTSFQMEKTLANQALCSNTVLILHWLNAVQILIHLMTAVWNL